MERRIFDTFGPLPWAVRIHNALPGWLQWPVRGVARRARDASLRRDGFVEVAPGRWDCGHDETNARLSRGRS